MPCRGASASDVTQDCQCLFGTSAAAVGLLRNGARRVVSYSGGAVLRKQIAPFEER